MRAIVRFVVLDDYKRISTEKLSNQANSSNSRKYKVKRSKKSIQDGAAFHGKLSLQVRPLERRS